MTDAELDRLDRLCAAATPGPWKPDAECLEQAVLTRKGRLVADCCISNLTDAQCAANGRFVAAARSALPELVAEVRRLRAALEGAAEYIYNPFEPDNQSPAYHKARAALAGGDHG